ncbi:heavy-metal-associated domain-containing protein [Massilia cavernae]|nr:heavy-metal-associated domain-containing protein [Massilia cavernae]
MTYINLQLASSLHEAAVSRVVRALRAVPGVHAVDAQSEKSTVGINFDQDRTSQQELENVLADIGHRAKQNHSNGSCCGSCGG